MTHIDTDAGAHMNFERLLQFMEFSHHRRGRS